MAAKMFVAVVLAPQLMLPVVSDGLIGSTPAFDPRGDHRLVPWIAAVTGIQIAHVENPGIAGQRRRIVADNLGLLIAIAGVA